MSEIGSMQTKKSIDQAMSEIRRWLEKLKGVDFMSLHMPYDPATKVSLIRFKRNGKTYEFKSQKQANCRLNMWGIAKVMENKVRAHLMQIEDFDTAMSPYLQLEAPSGYAPTPVQHSDVNAYVILGASPIASNEELIKAYKHMAKAYHPDMAGSEEAKKVFQVKFSEINEAWSKIKIERGIN